jgi:hypothetical protein
MSQTKTGSRSVAAIGAVLGLGLLLTAGSGAAVANSPAPRTDKPRTIDWTQTGVGAVINQNGSMLFVAAVQNSVEGDGAAVAEVTLNGNRGTQTTTRYGPKGVVVGDEEFTLGAPGPDGMIPLTGSGKCVKGTGKYEHNKCTYTFTGTQNPQTNVVNFEITGTTTTR